MNITCLMSVTNLLLADTFLWSVMALKFSKPSLPFQVLPHKICNGMPRLSTLHYLLNHIYIYIPEDCKAMQKP